jgi:hypothetical protein
MKLSKEIKEIISRWDGRWYALLIDNGEISLHYRDNGEKEACLIRRDGKIVLWSIHDQRNLRVYKNLKEFSKDLAKWVDRDLDETGLVIID